MNIKAKGKTATLPTHHGTEVKLYKFITSTIHASVVGLTFRQLYSRRKNFGYLLVSPEKN
jgi:hypothetical protein